MRLEDLYQPAHLSILQQCRSYRLTLFEKAEVKLTYFHSLSKSDSAWRSYRLKVTWHNPIFFLAFICRCTVILYIPSSCKTLSKEKVHTPHTFSPTQNPVYQIILLIQNPVCHPSFPRHRTQCTTLRHSGRSFLRLRSRCIILCADQTHTRHSLHSHHHLVIMYPLPSSQNTGSHFSKTTPILNSVTSLLESQNMGLELVTKVHSLEYGDKTILQFYVYHPKYLKTSL